MVLTMKKHSSKMTMAGSANWEMDSLWLRFAKESKNGSRRVELTDRPTPTVPIRRHRRVQSAPETGERQRHTNGEVRGDETQHLRRLEGQVQCDHCAEEPLRYVAGGSHVEVDKDGDAEVAAEALNRSMLCRNLT